MIQRARPVRELVVHCLLDGSSLSDKEMNLIGTGPVGMVRVHGDCWSLRDRQKFLSALRKHWGEEKVLSLLLEMEGV